MDEILALTEEQKKQRIKKLWAELKALHLIPSPERLACVI